MILQIFVNLLDLLQGTLTKVFTMMCKMEYHSILNTTQKTLKKQMNYLML